MKNINKQALTFLIILSFISSTFYLPVFASKAKATGLPVVDIVANLMHAKEILQMFFDMAAMTVAQKMTNDIVKSTVAWANTGFEDGPTFVTDPKAFALKTANSVASELINSTKLKTLCTPFQAKIQLALRNSYYNPQEEQFQCTFQGVTNNLSNFYNNFDSGGWQGWISMTQTPTNNPYGAYLTAKVDMDTRIADALGVQKDELNVNKNFLSTKDCLTYNPTREQINDYENGMEEGTNTISSGAIPYDDTKSAEACIKYGPVKTPGSQIASQLEKALPSGMQKLITVNHVEQLVGAFAQGILNRYVLSKKGTFSNTYTDLNSESDAPLPPAPPNIPDPLEGNVGTISDFCVGSGCGTLGTGTGSGTGTGTGTGNGTGAGSGLNVSASPTNPSTSGTVIWTLNNSTAADVYYLWDGTEIAHANTYDIGLGYATGPSVSIQYSTNGSKTMKVMVVSNTSDEVVSEITATPIYVSSEPQQ